MYSMACKFENGVFARITVKADSQVAAIKRVADWGPKVRRISAIKKTR